MKQEKKSVYESHQAGARMSEKRKHISMRSFIYKTWPTFETIKRIENSLDAQLWLLG
uniref:Uncharacterized protein n=1 Tax=Arundo donax TaxID=35708 RepID=A0A0A9HVG1_ARUDO